MDPALYYRMRRRLGAYKDTGPFVWFPWSGALFTNVFAHCWIDYAWRGVDDPARLGVKNRAAVDWWENSRRAVRMHQLKAVENPRSFRGFGKNVWGLTASDAPSGYAVPGLFPDPIPMPGAIPNVDFADFAAKDNWGDGTIAPYAGGIGDHVRSGASGRRAQTLSVARGRGRTPARVARAGASGEGGWGCGGFEGVRLPGFLQRGEGMDGRRLRSIDQGPLLLSIENARTGLVWQLFARSSVCAAGRASVSGWCGTRRVKLGNPTSKRRRRRQHLALNAEEEETPHLSASSAFDPSLACTKTGDWD